MLTQEPDMEMSEVCRRIREHFQQTFPQRLNGSRLCGIEEEFVVVDSDGQGADINVLFPELVQRGWQPKYNGETLIGVHKDGVEVGHDVGRFQLEIAYPPVASLWDHQNRAREVLALVDAVLAEHGRRRLADYSIQPLTPPEAAHWAPKNRSQFFRGLFDNRVHIQTSTASSQIHVDVTRDELLDVMELFLSISALLTALTANAPVWSGRIDPERRLSVRLAAWYGFTVDAGYWHNVFMGVPERMEAMPANLAELARIIGRAPFIIHDDGNGTMFAPGTSFEDWTSRNHLSDEEFARALANHGGTLWWDARPRPCYKTVEVRPACQNKNAMATHALVLGLTENLPDALRFIRERMPYSQWREWLKATIKNGMQVSGVPDLCAQAVVIAVEGLRSRGLGEEALLAPLWSRIAQSESPGHLKRRVFEQGGTSALLALLLS